VGNLRKLHTRNDPLTLQLDAFLGYLEHKGQSRDPYERAVRSMHLAELVLALDRAIAVLKEQAGDG
jgi:hypothetical protein